MKWLLLIGVGLLLGVLVAIGTFVTDWRAQQDARAHPEDVRIAEADLGPLLENKGEQDGRALAQAPGVRTANKVKMRTAGVAEFGIAYALIGFRKKSMPTSKCGKCLRFPGEARHAHRVIRERIGQNFDRNVAIQVCVARPKHLSHFACA